VTSAEQARHGAAFTALHDGRGFVMPNAWDAGSARVLADAGFAAIGTTSAGIAFSLGMGDHTVVAGAPRVSREQMFARIAEIVRAVDLPVNGDLEAGFGREPEAVAETIAMAIDAGLAGANIEDYFDGALYEEQLSTERIAAARAVIRERAVPFVLTARTDGLQLAGKAPMDAVVRRANLYREAGADCLFVPGVNDLEVIRLMVREIDGPLNVVMGLGGTGLTVDALRAAGVARMSLGGTFSRAAYGLLLRSARELFEHGTLGFAEGQASGRELAQLFGKFEVGQSEARGPAVR
jgi:2-methylisocitrate lyase-like PEP mutase family enzyme